MTSMNISTLWEKSTLWALKRYGVYSEDIQIENTIMKALCLRQAEHNAPNGISPAVKHMVCVHGLGSSGAAYGQLLPYLAKYWPEVWAPSAPGHGMSPPFPKSTTQTTEQSESSSYQRFQNMIYQAWEQCLLHLSKDHPIDLLGISLGGAISIRFAARFPKRVSSLMLCSPAGAILDENDIAHLKTTFNMSERGDGLRFLRTLYHQVPWWAPIMAPLVQMNLKRPEAQSLIQNLKAGDGLNPKEFQDLQVPTLLIWGQRERILPASSIDKLLQFAPKDFKLLQPECFSHTPQKEFPKELADYLISFQKNLISTPDLTQ